MAIQYGFISTVITMLSLWIISIVLERILNIKRIIFSAPFIESIGKTQNAGNNDTNHNHHRYFH